LSFLFNVSRHQRSTLRNFRRKRSEVAREAAFGGEVNAWLPSDGWGAPLDQKFWSCGIAWPRRNRAVFFVCCLGGSSESSRAASRRFGAKPIGLSALRVVEMRSIMKNSGARPLFRSYTSIWGGADERANRERVRFFFFSSEAAPPRSPSPQTTMTNTATATRLRRGHFLSSLKRGTGIMLLISSNNDDDAAADGDERC
jgi:hypothetical protein